MKRKKALGTKERKRKRGGSSGSILLALPITIGLGYILYKMGNTID